MLLDVATMLLMMLPQLDYARRRHAERRLR